MLFVVGSVNSAKVSAVQEAVKEIACLGHATVVALPASSEVSDNPLSLDETIRGAKNRAKNAFKSYSGASHGIGIESGLMEAPGTATGSFNICICAIYDGKNWFTGLSCGFEVPPEILSFVKDRKMDLSQACLASGISSNPNIGSTEGLIGILTRGKVDRKEYSKQAVQTALIQLEHSSWYSSGVQRTKSLGGA